MIGVTRESDFEVIHLSSNDPRSRVGNDAKNPTNDRIFQISGSMSDREIKSISLNSLSIEVPKRNINRRNNTLHVSERFFIEDSLTIYENDVKKVYSFPNNNIISMTVAYVEDGIPFVRLSTPFEEENFGVLKRMNLINVISDITGLVGAYQVGESIIALPDWNYDVYPEPTTVDHVVGYITVSPFKSYNQMIACLNAYIKDITFHYSIDSGLFSITNGTLHSTIPSQSFLHKLGIFGSISPSEHRTGVHAYFHQVPIEIEPSIYNSMDVGYALNASLAPLELSEEHNVTIVMNNLVTSSFTILVGSYSTDGFLNYLTEKFIETDIHLSLDRKTGICYLSHPTQPFDLRISPYIADILGLHAHNNMKGKSSYSGNKPSILSHGELKHHYQCLWDVNDNTMVFMNAPRDPVDIVVTYENQMVTVETNDVAMKVEIGDKISLISVSTQKVHEFFVTEVNAVRSFKCAADHIPFSQEINWNVYELLSFSDDPYLTLHLQPSLKNTIEHYVLGFVNGMDYGDGLLIQSDGECGFKQRDNILVNLDIPSSYHNHITPYNSISTLCVFSTLQNRVQESNRVMVRGNSNIHIKVSFSWPDMIPIDMYGFPWDLSLRLNYV